MLATHVTPKSSLGEVSRRSWAAEVNGRMQIKAHRQQEVQFRIDKFEQTLLPNKKWIDFIWLLFSRGIYVNKPKVSTSLGNENWIPSTSATRIKLPFFQSLSMKMISISSAFPSPHFPLFLLCSLSSYSVSHTHPLCLRFPPPFLSHISWPVYVPACSCLSVHFYTSIPLCCHSLFPPIAP